MAARYAREQTQESQGVMEQGRTVLSALWRSCPPDIMDRADPAA